MHAPIGILPGIDQAREYLGLTLKQIAQAVKADESTLHRWRSGVSPSPVFLARLEALDELAKEMRSTFRSREAAREWLQRPVPALEDRRPLDLILAGKAEVLTGMLYALNSGMSL
jgi:putative toxin-antitoxin system antitoxin component (TIGR02293 family)